MCLFYVLYLHSLYVQTSTVYYCTVFIFHFIFLDFKLQKRKTDLDMRGSVRYESFMIYGNVLKFFMQNHHLARCPANRMA